MLETCCTANVWRSTACCSVNYARQHCRHNYNLRGLNLYNRLKCRECCLFETPLKRKSLTHGNLAQIIE